MLDELPLHLIPRSFFKLQGLQNSPGQPLFLNPECWIGPGENLPDDLAKQPDLVAGFARKGTMAWVRNAASERILPFWLGPRFEAMILNLRPNQPAQEIFGADDLRLLLSAGILTYEEEIPRRLEEWRRTIATSAETFQKKQYVPIANLIHPFHVAALRRYYRSLIRRGKFALGDGQSSKRYVAHNEPVARFFHQQITATVSAIAGEPVKPSYVYFASYLSGAELKKHTDRAQCEFSVTFCLDASPEPELENPWPICLDTPQGRVMVYQALGDGLLYRGTRVPHSRDVLVEGRTSTSIFFHYVPADFAGTLG